MAYTILNLISEQYAGMTRSAKKLSDYILNNKTSVQYMSITSLAKASKVSEATITRFCKNLQLEGYNELKLALAKADNTTAMGDPSDDGQSVTDTDDFINICKKLYQIDKNALSETLELANSESISQAVSLISNAKHIYCFGQGGSNVMAMEAWARFSTISSRFIHIADSHMQAMAAALCEADDVILFFSYSGSTRDMLDVLRPAKNNGTSIILVTHFSNSPAAALSDVILLCGSNESPLQSGSIAAKISQLFIIDYLFYFYGLQNPQSSAKAKNATAQATARKLL